MTKEKQKEIHDLMREIKELSDEILANQPETASATIQKLINDIFRKQDQDRVSDNDPHTSGDDHE